MSKLIYIAIDTEDSTIISTNSTFELCEARVMDYFGINPNKEYSLPAICEGYTKIHYSEIEDDLDGYWIFKDDDVTSRINLHNVVLDESI